jgi:hypothetical protein
MNAKTSKLMILTFATVAGPITAMAQTTPAPRPAICDRTCWAARASVAATENSVLNRAVIHHTEVASHQNTTGLDYSKSMVRGIQNYHMDNNGWIDIGYNFLIDKFGNIFEGRRNSIASKPRGTHDGTNVDSIGVSCMGNFDIQTPPSAQRGGCYDVIAWKMPSGWSPYGTSTYGPKSNVGKLCTHKDAYNVTKSCPGAIFYNNYITSNTSGGEARNGVAGRRTPSYVIVDNTSSGFSSSANWTVGTSSVDKYGSSYEFRATAPVSDPAVWTASLATRTYSVYAWWTEGSNRSTGAAYHVEHAGGTTVVAVNQQINGGQWNLLGTWGMSAGANTVMLSCWAATGSVVIADAIKWQ